VPVPAKASSTRERQIDSSLRKYAEEEAMMVTFFGAYLILAGLFGLIAMCRRMLKGLH